MRAGKLPPGNEALGQGGQSRPLSGLQGSSTAHPRSTPPRPSLLPLLQLELDVNPRDGTACAPPPAAMWSRPLLGARDPTHCMSFPTTRLSGLWVVSHIGEGQSTLTRAEVSLTSAGVCVPCISEAQDPITLQSAHSLKVESYTLFRKDF